MRRRLAAALAAGVALLAVPAPGAAAATTAPTPSLSMVSETPVVTGSGEFTTVLRVSGPLPAGARLSVTGYGRLTSRTAFSRAVGGHPGYSFYQAVVPLASLRSADGSLSVTLPVDTAAPAGSTVPVFEARSGSSVYPVTFQVTGSGGIPDGQPLTGFVVYSTGPAQGLPPLSVSVTVPVDGPTDPGPTVTRLPDAEVTRLASLAAALDHPTVPVTLQVDPDVVARLAASGAPGRQVVAELAARVAGGDELLAAPYFPTDPAAATAAGLGAELRREWSTGADTLTRQLQGRPDTSDAVIGSADAATVSALAGLGVQHLVAPEQSFVPLAPGALPYNEQGFTYARPQSYEARGAPSMPVYPTDAALSGLLVAGGDQVLHARDVVAGLAQLQLEAPSHQRGVTLVVPAGSGAGLVDGLLGGLHPNPYVTPVTVAGLFGSVPVAQPAPDRYPVASRSAQPLTGASAVAGAAAAVEGLATLVPSEVRTVAPLDRQVLSAASGSVDAARRGALAAAVAAAVQRAEAGVSLPGSSSVTLTSSRGTIPLTVLSNPSLTVHAALRVESQKLEFLPFNAGAGRCTPSGEGEVCPLVLDAEATTVRIPVLSRTSGVFALSVVLESPDGSVVLASDRDTVRSTAFAGIGLVLIIVAALGLVSWWVSNARHGRRARQLVDPPTGEVAVVALPAVEDPVVAEFFASPPPEWEPASPSGPRRSPNH